MTAPTTTACEAVKPGLAAAVSLLATAAAAEMRPMPETTRFCPSWAKAHERALAGLNGGHAPFKTNWKGCIVVRKGTSVEGVGSDADQTEIVFRGRRWFADQALF